jgi:hypothetical protein
MTAGLVTPVGCSQEASLPCQVDLSIGLLGCPHEMPPAFPRVNVSRENKEEFLMPFTTHCFHHILFVIKSSQLLRREELNATSFYCF